MIRQLTHVAARLVFTLPESDTSQLKLIDILNTIGYYDYTKEIEPLAQRNTLRYGSCRADNNPNAHGQTRSGHPESGNFLDLA